VVDEEATERRPEDGGEDHRHPDDGHDPAEAGGAGGAREHHRADGHDHAAADALKDAEDDERLRRPRQAGEGRAEREEDHRGDPQALGAEAPCGPAGDRDDRSQREHVAGRHPLDVGQRRVQVAAERVEGDVDDRRVEDREDRADDDDGGDAPDVRLDAFGGHISGAPDTC
jgi:hypothetical protein